jgi:hypothetical protein
MLMRPWSTLKNCGSSSREVLRRKAPKGVMRGSSFVAWATIGPLSMARIERNL